MPTISDPTFMAEQARFAALRDRLVEWLSPDRADELLSVAEEYGGDYAADALQADRSRFATATLSISDMAEIKATLTGAVASLDRMDTLLMERHDRERMADPGAAKVFQTLGRAFVLERDQVRYLDTHAREPLLLREGGPAPRVRSRRRDRDR